MLRLSLPLLSLCLLASPSWAASSPLPSPSNLTAVSQCVAVASSSPRLLSLSYQSALLSSSVVTSPPLAFPSASPGVWSSSFPLLPVTGVVSSLPASSSSLRLYENLNGARGAAILRAPHTLPSLDVWVLGGSSSETDSFTFYVQSSVGRSAAGEVALNVSSSYTPPFFASQPLTLATLHNSVASLLLSSYVRLSAASSASLVCSFPLLPSLGALYALPASLAAQLPNLAPLLPAVDAFDPLSFLLPSSLPSGEVSDALSSAMSEWQVASNVTSVSCDAGVVLVYRANGSTAQSASDSFQVWVDDGLSTMPGTPLSVSVQLLTDDRVVLSSPTPVDVRVSTYQTVPVTLPCVQSVAPSSQCRISLLTLPTNGQVSTNGSLVSRVPYPLVNNTLAFSATDNNSTAAQTAVLKYVAYNGVAVSSVSTLTVTVQPAPAPPSCTSFSVQSVDRAEVLVRLTASSLYNATSYRAAITSLPDPSVGSLVTSDERAAISTVPFVLSSSTSPQLIFSPNVAARGGSSATSFSYHVVDESSQLSCPSSTVSVALGSSPLPPFVIVSPLVLQTTQVDPIVITLSGSSVSIGPVVATVTSLPYNGTLYQYQTLPAQLVYPRVSSLLASLFTDSSSWTSADSPSSLASANSSYAQLYNNVSATVQAACLTSAAVSCLPPSVLGELTPVTASSSIVLDPLLRLLYIPARFGVSDAFSYNVSASSVAASSSAGSGASTGWVSVQLQGVSSPPAPLPPVAWTTFPLSRYLPSLPAYQLAQYADDELSISLHAEAGYSPNAIADSTVSFYVSRLPVNGTLSFQNATCDGCWSPIPSDALPFEVGWLLRFVPAAGQTGALSVSYLYASFDFFVFDSLTGSSPPTSVSLFVYPPLQWPSCASPSVQAVRGEQLVVALGNWVDLSLDVIVHSLPRHGLLYQSTADGQAAALIWQRDTLLADPLLKLVYVPYANASLPFSFDELTYGVYNSSTQLLSPPCTVNLTLLTLQPMPAATPLILNTTENFAVSVQLGCSVPPCVYQLLSLPAHGQLSQLVQLGNVTNASVISSIGPLSGSGLLQFQPVDYESGNPIDYNYYSNFSYSALPASSSPLGSSAVWSQPALVVLQVVQQNYPPQFAAQNLTMPGDSYLVVSLAANNTKEQPAAAYTVTIASLPARGTLYQYTAQDPTSPMGLPIGAGKDETMQVQELDANGDLDSGTNVVFVPDMYTHADDYASFSFYASDETQISGRTPLVNVTINVTPRNHAPVATPITLMIDGSDDNQQVSINLLAAMAASDVDGDEIVYSITSWPAKGVLWSCERLPVAGATTGPSGGDGGQLLPGASDNCQPTEDSSINPSDLSPVATLNLSSFIIPSGGVAYSSNTSVVGGNSTVSLNVTEVYAHLLSGAYRNAINSSLHFSLQNAAGFYPYLNFTYTAFDAHLANTSSSITVLLHCPPGTSPNIWESSGLPCISCPTGAVCSSDGTYPPFPMYGYWPMLTGGLEVGKGGNMVFELCHPASACLGGVQAQCASGYEGKLCGSCQAGYVRMDVQCVQCPSRFLFLTAVSVGACVLLLALSALQLSKHRLSFSSSFILLVFFQTVSVFNNFNLRWPNAVSSLFTAVSLTSFNFDLFAAQCYVPDADYRHKWIATILLLPVVAALMVAAWAAWLAVQWLGLRRLLWRMRRSDRPLLLSASTAASWAAFQCVAQSSITRLLRYQSIWLLCAFLPLLAKACQLFECVRLPDGTTEFFPDSSLQCTQSWHVTLAPFAILFIVVYSLFTAIWVAGGVSKHVPRGVQWSGWCWSSRLPLTHSQRRSMDAAKGRATSKAVEWEATGKQAATSLESWPSLASSGSSTAPFYLMPLSSPTASQTASSSAAATPAATAAAAASAIPSSSAGPATANVAFASKRAAAAVDYIDASFAFLTSPFKPVYFYWYLVVVLRLLLLAVTCLLYPGIPIVGATMALVVLLTSALLQCVLAPYRSSSLNRLELVCLLTAAFVLFCGVIFKGDTSASMSTTALSDLFIVFVFVALALAISFACFIYWRKVERLLYCRRCRRVPTLRVKSAELVFRLGRTARERVQDRRDLAVVRPRKVDQHAVERERAEMVRAATAQQQYMSELHSHHHAEHSSDQLGADKRRPETQRRADEESKSTAPAAAPLAAASGLLLTAPLAALSHPLVLLPVSIPLRPAVSDCSSPVSAGSEADDASSVGSGDADSVVSHRFPAMFVIAGNTRRVGPAATAGAVVGLHAARRSDEFDLASPSSLHDDSSVGDDSRAVDELDSDDCRLSCRSVSSSSGVSP